MIHNEQELARSIDSHDTQLAVLTRLMVKKFNELHAQIATMVPVVLEPLTYDGLTAVFKEFNEFRARPDFAAHQRKWFAGEDVSAEALGAVEVASSLDTQPKENYPDGAFVFGGDYAPQGDERQAEEDDSHDVPSLQEEDTTHDQPSNQEASPAMPAVQEGV